MPDTISELDHLRRAAEKSGVVVEEFVLPESRHFLAGRMRMHCLDWNGGARKNVLLLHGGGLTAHTWDLVCLALRPDYHCLALDLRGHGDSEWSTNVDYSLSAHVSDVERVVEVLGLRDFVLVGMSLGGLTALAYAARHSAILSGLVIVDVTPKARRAASERIRNFMSQPAELESVEDFVQRAIEFNPARDPVLLRRSLLHNLHQLPDGKWTWKYDRRHRDIPGFDRVQVERGELWARVGRIVCPTLVIRGGRSDILSDGDAEELVAALPDGGWGRVENAGHTVQGDNPRGLLELLRPFLDRLPSATEFSEP